MGDDESGCVMLPGPRHCTVYNTLWWKKLHTMKVFYASFCRNGKAKGKKPFKTIKMSEIIVQVSEDHFSSQIRGGHAMLQCK